MTTNNNQLDTRKTDPKDSIQFSSLSLLLNDISKYPSLSEQELATLFGKYSDGDTEARDAIFNSNLRLVYTVAKNFTGKGVDLNELFQEGSLGLLRAIDGFNVSMNKKFSTYSYPWIEKYVRNAIMKYSRDIRLPSHIYEAASKICKTRQSLIAINGCDPTSEEISFVLGNDYTPEYVEYVDSIFYKTNCESLDREIFEDTPLQEIISPISNEEEVSCDQCRTKLIRKMLMSLDDRTAYVIDRSFGITTGKEETLEKIGKALCISRERVRQIREKGLKTLKEKFSSEISALFQN